MNSLDACQRSGPRGGLALAVSVFAMTVLGGAACGPDSTTITITGSIGSGTPVEVSEIAAPNVSALASSGPITQVLVYRDFGNADLASVDATGHFAVDVDRRRPCGLVFLAADNAVVGYLSLADGIEALPMSLAADGVVEIDLEDIAFSNGVGTPGHNPIESGGETELGATELALYRLQGALFSAIVRNLDMNGDGVIDVLSDRRYWMMFGAVLEGPPVSSHAGTRMALPTLSSMRLSVSDYHPAVLTPAPVLSTPDGSAFTCTQSQDRWAGDPSDPSEIPVYVWDSQNHWNAFGSGEYHIDYDVDHKQLDFAVQSPLATDKLIAATDLWFEQRDPSTVTLHWQWRMLDGADLDVSRLLKIIIAGFTFNDGRAPLFKNPMPQDTEFSFDLDQQALNHVEAVSITARDYFGNEYLTSAHLTWLAL